MTILAFDTCFGACSVAVAHGVPRIVVAERIEIMDKGYSERLVPMIAAVLAEAERPLATIATLAVTIGPGSFTGVRTGIAVARGLALAQPLEVRGATSLQVMAADIRTRYLTAPIAVAMATRDGLVYFQTFTGPDAAPFVAPCLATPAAAAAMIAAASHVVGGTGAGLVVTAALALPADRRPVHVDHGAPVQIHASRLAAMAERLPILSPVAPLYLRDADARPPAANEFGFASSPSAPERN